jgi:hypothetical protein
MRLCIKIDCAEFKHSHEVAKLIGSPPGYLGHRETHPLLSQEVLDQHHADGVKMHRTQGTSTTLLGDGLTVSTLSQSADEKPSTAF